MRLRLLPAADAEWVKEISYCAKDGRRGTAPRFAAAVEAAGQMALRHPRGGVPSVARAPASREEGCWLSRIENDA